MQLVHNFQTYGPTTTAIDTLLHNSHNTLTLHNKQNVVFTLPVRRMRCLQQKHSGSKERDCFSTDLGTYGGGTLTPQRKCILFVIIFDTSCTNTKDVF
jgi:hypothetical protein